MGCIEAGQSITDVALFFGVHHFLISRLWKQFQTTQTVVQRSTAGCPRVTTPTEDRYIAYSSLICSRRRTVAADIALPMDAETIDVTRVEVTLRFRLATTAIYRYSAWAVTLGDRLQVLG